MPSPTDFCAVGRVVGVEDGAVIFQPRDTAYELRLITDPMSKPAAGQRIEGIIHLTARKVYTVPSGGLFVVPIFGPPRIVQGRIKYLDETMMVVQAGTAITVDLPKDDSAYDLAEGPLAVGALVNVTALPGAKMETAAIAP